MTLHDKIMNLRVGLPSQAFKHYEFIAYKDGHRDARHAAAELANEADATIARLIDALEPFAAGTWTKELAAKAYAALAAAKQ